MNSSERTKQCRVVVQVDKAAHQCTLVNPQTDVPKHFTYDQVYDDDCTQRQVYDESAFPLVESVIKGYNGTIFAYGQTGCGKTFTMLGDTQDPANYGIIPNSFQHIFGTIGESEHEKCFLVRCSYSEIYNEEIRDLLCYDPQVKLELKENKDKGIFVKNLSSHVMKNIADIDNAMKLGNSHRVTKGTNMNERSSRSHAIFTIYIETSEDIQGKQTVRAGKLNLVDLAGSERQKKTGAVGERLREAIEINLSLSALGNVISALVDGQTSHVPYRDSKLTRLLQDSLGGNTKTVMIAVVSPADYNYDESLSTLRYASRAKFIQNKPRINEDPKDALLRQYAEEITRLKSLLEAQGPHEAVDLPQCVILGGDTQDSHLQERLKEQRALVKKLKLRKKREKQLLKQKELKEQQLLEKEAHYQDLHEEVIGLRKLVTELKEKYDLAQTEIKDLNHESEVDKENLLENVRDLEHECDFLSKVLGYVLPKGELKQIRKRARFDEFNNTWIVPPFSLQQKAVVFPKLPNKQQFKHVLQSELKSRTVVYRGTEPTEEMSDAFAVVQCENDNFIGSVPAERVHSCDARPTTSGQSRTGQKRTEPFRLKHPFVARGAFDALSLARKPFRYM